MRVRRIRRRVLQTLGLLLLAGIVAGTVLAFTPVTPLTATVPASRHGPDDPPLRWLHASPKGIFDDQGRTVLLRGFNVSSLVSFPNDPPAPLDESDARLIQQAGFNVVRLGIDWSQIEPVRGRIDTGYLDRVQSAVEMFNRRDLYVVLDMHFRLGWTPRYGTSGAPGWATFPLIPGFDPLPSQSWGPALSPGAVAAQSYFWVSPDWQRDFFRAWQAVATRFRNNPGVAAYDIFNEPEPAPLPPSIFEKYWMWPLYKHSIEAIGKVDPNHIFMVEGLLFLTIPTVVVPLQAPNLVYGNHLYVGSLLPPFWSGDPGPERRFYDRFEHEASRLPAPLWIGELGFDLTREREAVGWIDASLAQADDRKLGWAWWQWRQNRYWGVRDRNGDHLNQTVLRHLARPYLQAAPAGVRGGRGDGVTGLLDITVQDSHAGAPVVVGWSTLTLTRPRVAGACVRGSSWDPSLSRLTLVLVPGQGCLVRLLAS